MPLRIGALLAIIGLTVALVIGGLFVVVGLLVMVSGGVVVAVGMEHLAEEPRDARMPTRGVETRRGDIAA